MQDNGQEDELDGSSKDKVLKKLKRELEVEDLRQRVEAEPKISQNKLDKLRAIKLKINDARKQNLAAVIEEDRRNSNAGYLQHLKKKDDEVWKQSREQELEFKGIKNNKDLDRPAYRHKDEKVHDKELSENGKLSS